jgi:putative phosphoesterase
MKIAILSDIHGNSYALEAVLNAVRQQGIVDLFILGDLVGYYYFPDKVLRMLEDFNTKIIQGNHEAMLKSLINGTLDAGEVRKKYGSGASIALKRLSMDQINLLINLPISLRFRFDNVRFTLCHGSPWDPDYYVYPNSSLEIFDKCTLELSSDFLLLGHTHHPFMTHNNGVLILNPGSVGQPRDQNYGASWAIINTVNKAVIFKQTPYDHSSLLIDITKFDSDILFLKEVLTRK